MAKKLNCKFCGDKVCGTEPICKACKKMVRDSASLITTNPENN